MAKAWSFGKNMEVSSSRLVGPEPQFTGNGPPATMEVIL